MIVFASMGARIIYNDNDANKKYERKKPRTRRGKTDWSLFN